MKNTQQILLEIEPVQKTRFENVTDKKNQLGTNPSNRPFLLQGGIIELNIAFTVFSKRSADCLMQS